MFSLKFDTDNSAFYDDDDNPAPEEEIVRILREVADKIENRNLVLDPDLTLLDVNGNPVGSAHYR